MPAGSRLQNAVVRAPNLPFAIIAGDGLIQHDRILIEDVICHGAGISLRYCFDSHISRVRVLNSPIGVEIVRGYEIHLQGCHLQGITDAGIRINGRGNDQYMRDTRIVCAGTAAVGVDVIESGAVYQDNVSISFASTGFRFGLIPQKIVEFVFSSRCAADQGSGHGWHIGAQARSLRSVGDWSSSNKWSGVHLEGASDVSFCAMRCYQNHHHGIHLVSGADLAVEGCTLSANGSAGPPNYHGLVVGNVHGARITHNRSGGVSQHPAIQGYGFYVSSPLANNIVCVGNDWRHNLLGGAYLIGDCLSSLNRP